MHACYTCLLACWRASSLACLLACLLSYALAYVNVSITCYACMACARGCTVETQEIILTGIQTQTRMQFCHPPHIWNTDHALAWPQTFADRPCWQLFDSRHSPSKPQTKHWPTTLVGKNLKSQTFADHTGRQMFEIPNICRPPWSANV